MERRMRGNSHVRCGLGEKQRNFCSFRVYLLESDEDGLSIQSGLLYTFSKFARFMIEFGMIKIAESPVYIQGDKFFYPSDPLVPGTRFPVGLNLNKEYKHIKGLGSLDKDEATKSFFDPGTRRLITVTLDGLDYSMGLVENIDARKKLLFDSGILSNPYGFNDL